MPFGSHPSTGLGRYPAAIALAAISLVAGVYFGLKGPVTGLAPAGAPVLRVTTGSGAQTAIIDDRGQAAFSGALITQSTLNVAANATFQSGAIFTRTSDMGWSAKSGANTACNTTCTSACVVGLDVASGFLACSNAAADTCLCAGGS